MCLSLFLSVWLLSLLSLPCPLPSLYSLHLPLSLSLPERDRTKAQGRKNSPALSCREPVWFFDPRLSSDGRRLAFVPSFRPSVSHPPIVPCPRGVHLFFFLPPSFHSSSFPNLPNLPPLIPWLLQVGRLTLSFDTSLYRQDIPTLIYPSPSFVPFSVPSLVP